MDFPFVIKGQFVPGIAQMIFSGSAEPEGPKSMLEGQEEGDFDDILKAREVCKDWRDIIDTQSGLWSSFGGFHTNYYLRAVEENKIDIVRNFVAFGKEPNPVLTSDDLLDLYPPDNDHWNPYDVGATPLHASAELGRIEIFKLIIQKAENKNPETISGSTPMHIAAWKGHNQIIQVLMEDDRVGEKNPAKKDGTTPLHLAASCGNAETCKIIMQHTQERSPADTYGGTPLHAAAVSGHTETFKILMESVQDKNPANKVGFTPLHYAAGENHLHLVKILVENITDICPGTLEETEDSGFAGFLEEDYAVGTTPLHLAAGHGQFETFKYLMEMVKRVSGNINPPDGRGDTPLHSAIEEGHTDIARLILQNVEDLHPINEDGESPLDAVKRLGWYDQDDVVKMWSEFEKEDK